MIDGTETPRLRVWLEYFCPWSYIAAVRLRPLIEEYRGRVGVELKALPLGWVNEEPTPRGALEAEWWLAALHEPRARFAPYEAETYPYTTLPAFEAAACARMQGEEEHLRYDLLVREAFFARALDISRRGVLLALADEARLDMQRFEEDLASGRGMERVRAEYEEGSSLLEPRGTPSFVLPDRVQVFGPATAEIRMQGERVVGVGAMPCAGDGCTDVYRELFERALAACGAGNPGTPLAAGR